MGRLSSFLGWRGGAVSSFQPRKPKTVLAPDSENNPINQLEHKIHALHLPWELVALAATALRSGHS
jgi:hypothetical protein